MLPPHVWAMRGGFMEEGMYCYRHMRRGKKKRRYPIMAGMSQIDDAAEQIVVVDSLLGRWE